MIFYFVMSARYILYKQKYIQGKLQRLTDELERRIIKRRPIPPAIWRKFTYLHKEIVTLFLEIKASNRFWSKYLAIYFVCYLIQTTYMSYSFLFEETEMDFFGRKFFIFFGTQIGGVLLWVNYECSAIVAKNVTLFKMARYFVVHLQQVTQLTKLKLLKIDQLQANHKSVLRMGFSLLNVVRVNSKIFEVVQLYTFSNSYKGLMKVFFSIDFLLHQRHFHASL